MLRFKLRTLMILLAAVGLWLSTIAGYESADDVQALILLSVLVASAVAAIIYEGQRRAFCVGFFLTILTTVLGRRSAFLDTALALPWAQRLLDAYHIYQNLPNNHLNPRYFFFASTIHVVVLLLIATAMGFLGVLVYGAIEKPKASTT